MRTKEGSDDYRYFPEPDLPPLEVDDAWIEEIRSQMPEMPGERRRRYVNDLGLTDYDAMVLTQTKEMADFFEEAVKDGGDAKKVANYLMNDVNSYLNNQHVDLDDTKLTPANLAGMIKLIDDGTISSKMAKKVFQGILMVKNRPPSLRLTVWYNCLTSRTATDYRCHLGRQRTID